MQTIPGYVDAAVLHVGRRTFIVRATREDDGQSVVLKVLKDQFPDPATVARLRYECELLNRLDLNRIIGAGAPTRMGDRIGVELEDVGATSLEQALSDPESGLDNVGTALRVALDLVKTVELIHAEGVIHKDINPSNILYHADSQGIWLIDFGMATELTSEAADLAEASLDATPEFMSPEQTGRMNRSVDQRSDLYSLGATLYNLFSGAAPFDDGSEPLDRLGLVHAHIARRPIPLTDRRPDLPGPLSDIVMKLLRKDVERRYQSAYGLRRDLEQCLAEFQASGRIEPFELRDGEVSGQMVVPEQLFGRDEELEQLMTALERARKGAVELLTVSGRAGIGKSRLVREMARTIAAQRGHFVSGKADQFFSDQPYGPFIHAFRSLVRRILAEHEADVEDWCLALREAVGPNGRLIVDVVPEVELLLGPQPELPSLGPVEFRNLFQRTFLRFVGVFARPKSPLVLFLDDLQWADGPTLDLLGSLATSPDLGHVMIIMAFRDGEVGPAHPLSVTLEELAKAGTRVGKVDLGPLRTEDVHAFVEAALRESGPDVDGLVELIYEKTAGNPFFLNQFLTALHADGALVFEPEKGGWTWHLEEIRERDYTDNVVELVSSRIYDLPTSAQELLKVASCVGTQIELEQLAELRKEPPGVVAADLWPALAKQLLIPVTGSYLLARHDIDLDLGADSDAETANGGNRTLYRFLHDRVQQAAYSMLDDGERQAIHLDIGRSIHARGQPEGQALFDLVTHLNFAISLIEDPSERQTLAELDLAAGKQARSAAAFAPALEMFNNGMALLDEGAWVENYDLTMDLHLATAEAAYLNHQFDHMAAVGETVLDRAADLADEVRMREIEIQALIAQERRLEAIEVALPLLERLGARIPAMPEPADYGAGFGGAEGALAGRDVETLADLPAMTDSKALAATRILSRIFSATYFAAPQLLPLVIAKLVELSALHGNTQESAFGYTLYGLHLCAFADDIERGYAFGKLSREVLELTSADALKARTIFIQNICITHWKEPVRATLAPLLEAYQAGLDTGDMEYTAHSLMIHNQALIAVGHELSAVHARMNGQRSTIAALKEDAALSLFCVYQQTVANWLGLADDPLVLTGSHHDETQMVAQHQKTGDRTSLFHIYFNKTVLAFVLGDLDRAREFCELTRAHLDGAVGVYQIPLFNYYESLILLSGEEVSEEAVELVVANQERLKHWADHCPENQLHRWTLVEAVRARRRGDVAEAIDLFERAGTLAARHQYPQDEALAHEQHALFWLEKGHREIADLYFAKAKNQYNLWGAEIKVEQLAGRDRQLAPGEEVGTQAAIVLDIESVLKAGEALTGITSLDELMGAMMHITLENAGARRGLLFLPRKDQLVTAIEAFAEDYGIEMTVPTAVDEVDDMDPNAPFCAALVRYGSRANEPVVLDNALEDERFEGNAYLERSGVLSALCMPLSHKGKLAAVLYLENDLTQGAFTPDRLELLRLLSGQMAVSIENAKSYEGLVSLNRAYERFVPRQFLGYLGRDEITEVQLGDQVAADMSVLFMDVRNFARFAKGLSPADVFGFINGILGRVEPILARWGGFVDKYTGDGVMALFPDSADDAVACAVEMLHELQRYNVDRVGVGRSPVEIGIGIDSGALMLGTIGSVSRMDSTVISSVVNSAARIEGLNKVYAAHILIGASTEARLSDPASHRLRPLGQTLADGLSVDVFEVYDTDPAELAAVKDLSVDVLARAVEAGKADDYKTAARLLQGQVQKHPEDLALEVCLQEALIRLGQSSGDRGSSADDSPPRRTGGLEGRSTESTKDAHS